MRCAILSLAALVCMAVSASPPVGAEDAGVFPSRPMTEADAKLLAARYGAVASEFSRMGLHQTVGRTCRTFVTADSIRLIETPLPFASSTVTLPFASFLIWGADRPFPVSVLYHVYAAADAAYTADRPVPPGIAGPPTSDVVRLAPREPYPSLAAVTADHDQLAGGPFRPNGTTGAVRRLAIRPYFFPTQSDDPASVVPRKAEHVLQVTCLSDPDRVTNCLCAGTD